jgi:hypothetical protein
VTVTDSLIAVIALFVVAGGGIIVIDYFVLRRIRNQPTSGMELPPPDQDDTPLDEREA